MIAMLRTFWLPVVALLAAVFLVWLRAGPAEVASPGVLSVNEVYRRAEQELRRHGGIYQVTITMSDDLGLVAYEGTVRRWVDVRGEASREESELGELGRFTQITTREARYMRERDGKVTATSGQLWRCQGVGVAASAVLGCPGPLERSTTELRAGEYEGRRTIVLVTTGTSSGSDENFSFTRRLHLDPRTYLPVALESEGQVDFGQVKPTRQRHTYTGRFIGTDGVEPAFFDPVSIGYAPTDIANALDAAADLSVYWLGDRFAGGGGLPELLLAKVDVPSRGGPGYRYVLYYARADDRFGPPVVTLQLWPRATWDSVIAASRGANVWDDPCWRRDALPLAAGGATILSGFDTGIARVPAPATAAPGECPTGGNEKFLAHAYLDDTVVHVDAPSVFRADVVTLSPYNTLDGITAIVSGLRRR